LRRASLRVGFELPPLSPLVSVIMMTDIANQQAGLGPVNNQPDVAADANGPESPVLGLVQLVELQAWMRRVQLKIEGRGLYRLLFLCR